MFKWFYYNLSNLSLHLVTIMDGPCILVFTLLKKQHIISHFKDKNIVDVCLCEFVC